MKSRKSICLLLCVAMSLCGCSAAPENTVATVFPADPVQTVEIPGAGAAQVPAVEDIFSSRDLDASYTEEESISISLEGDTISCDSGAVEIAGTTATIRREGIYLISGSLTNGSVIVDAEKTEKVQLVLKNASISCESFAPLYVRQADKVFVTLAEGSENSLSGGESFVPDGEVNVDGALFSREDLTLNGSGKLTVSSPGGHGIVSKDSLRLIGGSYVLESAGHGLSGKDEVSIAGGSFDITAGQDGVHAENEEDTEGGLVFLAGGTYRIISEGDGISASGQCVILDGEYTVTAGGGSENAAQHSSGQAFFGGQRGGNRPSDGTSNGAHGEQQELPQGPREKGGMGGRGGEVQGRPDAASEDVPTAEADDAVSTKGIKAANLTIYGGSYFLDCSDDGLHANEDLTIQGGTLEIASGDDGIHGDGTVTVLSGTIEIANCYEGIEGLRILIMGGDITVTSSDDALNAAGGMDASGFGRRGDTFAQSGDRPGIVISGGTVKITAYGDGIDANGSLEITGGMVTVCGNAQGDSSVLDYDTSGIISGGAFLGTGSSSMAQTFSDSEQGVISVIAGNYSAGTKITLTDSAGKILLSAAPELDFAVVILSSPELRKGESYTLNIGGNSAIYTAK